MENKYFELILEEKIKGLKEMVENRFDYNDKKIANLLNQAVNTNGRLTKVELWRSALVGGWIMAVALLGLFLKFFK